VELWTWEVRHVLKRARFSRFAARIDEGRLQCRELLIAGNGLLVRFSGSSSKLSNMAVMNGIVVF